MADTPTTNYGSAYYNINQCLSFNGVATTTLSGFFFTPCSEVIIWNQTGQIVYLYDQNRFADENRLAIPAAAAAKPLMPYVIRGLTNADQVSAKTASGNGAIYWRSQFFSSNPRQ